MPVTDIDDFDARILEVLQDDGRRTNADLAQAVGLSPSPCLRRVRALEQRGVIRRYVTLLDPEAVGLPVSVFVSVTLDRQVEENLAKFESAIRQRPEVMECYLMTGDADYLLRVVAADLGAFERFLMDHLTRIPGVANIRSSFALKQVQYRTALPLAHLHAPGARRARAGDAAPPSPAAAAASSTRLTAPARSGRPSARRNPPAPAARRRTSVRRAPKGRQPAR